jgi:hypothetical protein
VGCGQTILDGPDELDLALGRIEILKFDCSLRVERQNELTEEISFAHHRDDRFFESPGSGDFLEHPIGIDPGRC